MKCLPSAGEDNQFPQFHGKYGYAYHNVPGEGKIPHSLSLFPSHRQTDRHTQRRTHTHVDYEYIIFPNQKKIIFEHLPMHIVIHPLIPHMIYGNSPPL